MTSPAKLIRKYISPNGFTAKALSVVYLLSVLVVFMIVANTFRSSVHPDTTYDFSLYYIPLSTCPLLITAVIAAVQDNEYGIVLLGVRKQRRQAFIDRLDERQLETRRRIFEKSYMLLASVALFASFTQPAWFGNGLTYEGAFIIGYNIYIFIIALPSLFAVWARETHGHDLG